MCLKRERISVTVDASGDGTTTTRALLGKIFAVHWNIGTCAAGVDVTLAVVNSETTNTILTLTDANASALYYPRHAMHGATGSALTATAGGDNTMPLLAGALKVTIAQGGVSKTGIVTVFYED